MIKLYNDYLNQKINTRLKAIRHRCNNPNNSSYQWYGGRGIKCLLTTKELKELWIRDKAFEMEFPTIDRIDNDGNYTFDNCQFIENIDNVKKIYTDKLKK